MIFVLWQKVSAKWMPVSYSVRRADLAFRIAAQRQPGLFRITRNGRKVQC